MKSLFRKGVGNLVRKGFLLINLYLKVIKYFYVDIVHYKPDTVLVCKGIFPRHMPSIFKKAYSRLLKDKKVIWVFDDNILKSGEISKCEWDILCASATTIMVTHDYLKNELPPYCQSKVSYIPQADGDITREIIEKYNSYRNENYNQTISLVWVATDSSMPSLSYVIASLDRAASKLFSISNKQLALNVVCNVPANYKVKNIRINNIIWTRSVAVEQMAKSHIGIMPLIDNEYNKGKGGFKLIQCMAADLPVIASNVGWNASVVGDKAGILVDDSINTDTWIDAIIKLATDYDFWLNASLAAKAQSEKKFSFEKNKEVWEKILEVG
jgi:glycosyltransferase involved in cell wall biosynthesis